MPNMIEELIEESSKNFISCRRAMKVAAWKYNEGNGIHKIFAERDLKRRFQLSR